MQTKLAGANCAREFSGDGFDRQQDLLVLQSADVDLGPSSNSRHPCENYIGLYLEKHRACFAQLALHRIGLPEPSLEMIFMLFNVCW